MALKKSVRAEILDRDNHTCQLCGITGRLGYKSNDLVVHHKVRLKDGGTDLPENLEVLCRACHAKIHAEIHHEPPDSHMKSHDTIMALSLNGNMTLEMARQIVGFSSRSGLHKYVKSGELPARRIGKYWIINRDELVAWHNSRTWKRGRPRNGS